MQILLKRVVVIFATITANFTIVPAIAKPKDEMRSLVVTADYHPEKVNKLKGSWIPAAKRGVGLKTAVTIRTYRKVNGPFKTIDKLKG